MKIILGSDHGGFKYKEAIKEYLSSKEIEVEDMGTNSEESVDYPVYAEKVAKEVSSSGNKGILICGTGIGMSISANKVKGVRAAVAHDEFTAKMSIEHNDANILCMGERTSSLEDVKKMVDIFIKGESTEERHQRRVSEIMDIEKSNFK